MKKGNKVVYLIITLLFIAILICLYFLKNKEENNTQKEVTSIISGDKFKILENQNTFFSLQDSINTYYENIDNEEYISKIIIDEKESIDNYDSLSYIMNKAYYQKLDNSVVYFVSGYLIKQSYIEESTSYIDNVSYFIYEKNNTIRLKKLEADNLETYISKIYYKGNINLKDGVKFTTKSVSDQNKLSFYISNFINLLINRPKSAYSYLDNNMLKYYDKYSVFSSKINDFYSKMTPVIFSYSVSNVDGNNVYNFVDNNQNEIVITETSIMDYKIFINIY